MLKVYYSDFENFGDALNRHLIERLSGGEIKRTPYYSANLMGVGSIFYGGGFFWGHRGNLISKDRMRYYWRRIRDCFNPVLHVWGSGVLFDEPTPEDCVVYRKMKICAVRGKETLRILRRAGILSEDACPVLGDPGLLYPYLVPERGIIKKQYDLAIVPHYLDYKVGVALGEWLASKGIHVKVIDVMQPNPLNTIREIASAEKVASASLHGLIVSDAMGIPNKHLVLSDYEVDRNYGEGSFKLKFMDYYSAFGLPMRKYLTPDDFKNDCFNTLAGITQPSVTTEQVKEVQLALLTAFPEKFRGSAFEKINAVVRCR